MAAADPAVITVSRTDQLVDPGTGAHMIQFLPVASADTLVVDLGSVDQIAGFDPGSDVLDLHSLLIGTGLNLGADAAALNRYVTVTDRERTR